MYLKEKGVDFYLNGSIGHCGLVLNWWTPRIGAKRAGRRLMTKPKRYKRYSSEFKRDVDRKECVL